MASLITLAGMRRFAVSRSLFPPTSLKRALNKFGFVQADPIRAPARAQDLTLRHRVKNYRAGDLERRYSSLDIEEDLFINYGFVTRSVYELMHPRSGFAVWPPARRKLALTLLDFVRQRGPVHPRQVDEHFAHGTTSNYWGGSSNLTTHLMDALHYRGLLRVVRREAGIRIYGARELVEEVEASREIPDIDARIDALVDIVVNKYAPLPRTSLLHLISRLRYAVPQWHSRLKQASVRARERLTRANVDGVDWYWPEGERAASGAPADAVRLLAPFDPVVWDRRRFEILWGWPYRFEAYTPVSKRKLGYYALPMLWRDRVIGWANLAVKNGALEWEIGYVDSRDAAEPSFREALEAELEEMRVFLGL